MSNVRNLTNPDKTQGTVTAAIQTLKSNACAEITSENAAFSLGQGRISKLLPAGLSSVVCPDAHVPVTHEETSAHRKAPQLMTKTGLQTLSLNLTPAHISSQCWPLLGAGRAKGYRTHPPQAGRSA